MTGIIFAAGIGSRLKPYTDFHPKAIVPVHGVPAVVNVVRRLIEAGADRLIVNVHHFPEQVISTLEAAALPVEIIFSDESDRLLDTGGALAKIAREHPELCSGECPVIVHNADIFTDFPLDDMIAKYRSDRADACILVDCRRHSTRSFIFDNERRLCGWVNTTTGQVKPAGFNPDGKLHAPFGGVHILSPRIMSSLAQSAPGVPFSITDYYLDNCSDIVVKAYTPSKPYKWHDLGTPEKLAAANADI